MVCPMRFVLVGLSMLIMGIGFWRCMKEEEAQQEQQEQQQQRQRHQGDAKERKPRLWPSWRQTGSTLVDMFSGRYIYNHFVNKGHLQ